MRRVVESTGRGRRKKTISGIRRFPALLSRTKASAIRLILGAFNLNPEGRIKMKRTIALFAAIVFCAVGPAYALYSVSDKGAWPNTWLKELKSLPIAPMLWATGVGAEVIRPMAAPGLGGLLIADEVIDVFLPVLYFAVQKRRWRKLHGIALEDSIMRVTTRTIAITVCFGIGMVAGLPALGSSALDAEPATGTVRVLKCPDGGIQPQAAVDANGRVHIVYLNGDAAEYTATETSRPPRRIPRTNITTIDQKRRLWHRPSAVGPR